MPLPSGLDGAAVLKYFSQTLLSKYFSFMVHIIEDLMFSSITHLYYIDPMKLIFMPFSTAVLRDVKAKESPLEMVKSPDNDAKRMALYPNLDYRGLYNALVQLVDIVHLIQYGLHGN